MENPGITPRPVAQGYHIAQSPAPAKSGKHQESFQQVLSKLVDEVDGLQKDAEQSVQHFLTGKVTNVHEVMVAMEKADVSFKFMMEARNKLVDAYREVMRMQV